MIFPPVPFAMARRPKPTKPAPSAAPKIGAAKPSDATPNAPADWTSTPQLDLAGGLASNDSKGGNDSKGDPLSLGGGLEGIGQLGNVGVETAWKPGKPSSPDRSLAPQPGEAMTTPPGESDRVTQYTWIQGVDPVSGWTVNELRQALAQLTRGSFSFPGVLADDMAANPYIRKCLDDRHESFTTLPQVFTPTSKRGDGRRCCDFIKEIWHDIVPLSTLRTMHEHFLMMGFSIVGIDWEERTDGSTRYWLPFLKPWQPSLINYIQMTDPKTVDGGQWTATTMNKGLIHVQPGLGRWMLITKRDLRPWMSGGVRVLGESFVGWSENFHDNMAHQNRYGRGIMKLKYPRGYNVQELLQGAYSMAQAGGGGVLPCMADSEGNQLVDLDVLRADAAGYQTFDATEKRLIRNILLYFLGQDMTSLGQTGGYAQARVHQSVLWDKREEDARTFGDCRQETYKQQDGNHSRRVSIWEPCDGPWRTQLTKWIAYFNFGDFDLAPYVWWDGSEPEMEEDKANDRAKRGQMTGAALSNFAKALPMLQAAGLAQTPQQIQKLGESLGLDLGIEESEEE
jgi:hypothetical protein